MGSHAVVQVQCRCDYFRAKARDIRSTPCRPLSLLEHVFQAAIATARGFLISSSDLLYVVFHDRSKKETKTPASFIKYFARSLSSHDILLTTSSEMAHRIFPVLFVESRAVLVYDTRIVKWKSWKKSVPYNIIIRIVK